MKDAQKSTLWQTLKSIKHIEWIAILLIAGAAMLVIASALPKGGATPSPPEASQSASTLSVGLEARMEATLSLIDGAGKVRVMVNREEVLPAQTESIAAVTGVIVVAQGANDLSVRLELARAVQSLLNVPQKNIEIFAMAKESEE